MSAMAHDTLRLTAAEAAARLGLPPGVHDAPELARRLREQGALAVVITSDPHDPRDRHDWLDTPHARGWLTRPHGGPSDHAARFQDALAQGWVAADAAVLARLPDRADAADLPVLSADETPAACTPARDTATDLGVYAIVDSPERVRACAEAGTQLIQLRVKVPRDDPAMAPQIAAALQATRTHGATLVVNDHWRTALELGAPAIHLGQEDWIELDADDRAQIAAAQTQGLQLGLSSHSLWELCRARGAGADLIACGPVWPTLTKAMPWHPQGLDNLAWWVRMAGRPVIAIGGILAHAQLAEAARTGAATACVVRGLGDDPRATLPAWQAAWQQGRHGAPLVPPARPRPTLDAAHRAGP